MWPICDIWGCFRGCTVICLFGHRWARCQVSQLKLCIASTLVYVHCIFECLVSLRMAYYDLRFVWMGWGCIGGFYLSRNTMPGLHVTMGSCMQVHAHMTFTTLLPLHTQRKCQVLRLEVVFDCHSCQWNWSNNKAYLFCTETILLWVNCSPLLSQDENEAVSGPTLWFEACRYKQDVLPKEAQNIRSQSLSLFLYERHWYF